MKKLKTLYIILIFVITAIVIGVALGVRLNNFVLPYAGKHLHRYLSAKDMVSDSVSLSAFQNIDLDMNMVNLKLKEGEEFRAEYNFPKSIAPSFEVKDDTLYIEQHGDYIRFNNTRQDDFQLTLIVPKGTALDELRIDVDAGNVKLSDFNLNTLNIEADAANIDLSDITANHTKLEADAGNIETNQCSLGGLTVETDAGRVKMRKLTARNLKVGTDIGAIKLNQVTFQDGELTSSMGAIDLTGEFESLRAKCDLGSISIDSDAVENADLDLEVSLGSIRINGKNVSGTRYRN